MSSQPFCLLPVITLGPTSSSNLAASLSLSPFCAVFIRISTALVSISAASARIGEKAIDVFSSNRMFAQKRFEQIVQSNLRPVIRDLTITSICHDFEVIYVVIVPRSITANQANDHVYYRTRNFICEPMEDYEIRETMNRAIRPNVEISGCINADGERPNREMLGIIVKNESSVMAQHYGFRVFTPIVHKFRNIVFPKQNSIITCLENRLAYRLEWYNRQTHPLFPSIEKKSKF